MVLRLLCLGLVLTAVCLQGCTPSSKIEDNRVLISQDNLSHVVGMQWILQKMTVDGQDFPLTGEKPFIQIQADGKVIGFGSVNRYFGSVQVDGQGDLKWSPFGATKMACPEELMKQEDWYLKALPMTEQMSIEGIHLYLSSKDNQTELVFYVPVK